MSDTTMLQAILDRIVSMDKKIDEGFKKNGGDHRKINKRLDSIGSSVAFNTIKSIFLLR